MDGSKRAIGSACTFPVGSQASLEMSGLEPNSNS